MVVADLSRAGGHLVIVGALVVIAAVGCLGYLVAKRVMDRGRSDRSERTDD